MKRYIVLFIGVFVSWLYIDAQGLMDVSKYSSTGIMGTARYMSMAGSMGALGGDPSAIIDNPAALGIYRSSELSVTINATPSVTRSNVGSNAFKQDDFFFNFNHLSYLFSIQTGKNEGYVSSNFSFTYNRLKDFHRSISLCAENTNSFTNILSDLSYGFAPSELNQDNVNVPYLSVLGWNGYLIDPASSTDTLSYLSYAEKADKMIYKAVESGRIDEYNFTYSANIGHYLYVGAGVAMQTLDYRLQSAMGEGYYATGATAILNNDFKTSGFGWLLRLGIIARPVSFMRIGLSFQSPVWYSMRDTYVGEVETTATSTDPAEPNPCVRTPNAGSDYFFNSPLKAQVSLGFVIGKSALINVDYLYAHNRGARLGTSRSDDLFSEPEFAFENAEIKDYSLDVHTVKVGAEYRIASQFALRAGFAYRSPALKDNAARSIMNNTTRTDIEVFADKGSLYAAGGFGYRLNGFGIDITYAFDRNVQGFSPYQQGSELLINNRGEYLGYYAVANPYKQNYLSNIITMRHNVVLTLSYKF